MVNLTEREEEEEHSGFTDATVRKLRESVQYKMNHGRHVQLYRAEKKSLYEVW